MKPEQINIIKLGGNIIDSPAELTSFLSNFAQLTGRKILVHGGGKVATSIGKKLGAESTMVNGRRITDEATLDIVTMVYAGLLNKKIVAQLQSSGCNALGLSGVDGNLVTSERRIPVPIDFGFVGDPVKVNTALLEALLNSGIVPVICPLTHDGKGTLLNTNADSMASFIATALAPIANVQLVYCFEKNGVLENMNDGSSVLEHIDRKKIHELELKNAIHSGMLPKIDACLRAKEGGVHKVIIGRADKLCEILNNEFICTELS